MRVFVLAIGTVAMALSAPQDENRQRAETYRATQPGPAHAQLDALAGKWTVSVTFKVGSGPEQRSRANSEAQWILGGRFLQQHYKNDSGLEVWQFLGYDN